MTYGHAAFLLSRDLFLAQAWREIAHDLSTRDEPEGDS